MIMETKIKKNSRKSEKLTEATKQKPKSKFTLWREQYTWLFYAE